MPRGDLQSVRFGSVLQALDASVVVTALVAILVVPAFFMVPYNDEWLRLNYLADHSAWQWTIYHAQTWVVRPMAELLLGWVSLPNTRPALSSNFFAYVFLARFQRLYGALALAFCGLLLAHAWILAGRLRAYAHVTLLFALMLICILMSDELGYALYWADGYANILMPFWLLMLGLYLLTQGAVASAWGAGCVVLASLGHEVLCIYALGFVTLTLLLRRFAVKPWRYRTLYALLLIVCVGILSEQLFSAGPSTRSDVYLAKTGSRYDWAGMWLHIRQIDPLRSMIAYLATLASIATYRDRLLGLPERASADFHRNRAFWIVLLIGTVLIAFLPLAAVGLKKPRLAVSYYSVMTELFFILSGVLSFPIFNRWLRGRRPYVGSLLPILLLVALASKNIGAYQTAFRDFASLRAQANTYMEALFRGGDAVRLCRPAHPFSKANSTMTTRNEAQYFGIRKVKEISCR
jgi:hypothetical protein